MEVGMPLPMTAAQCTRGAGVEITVTGVWGRNYLFMSDTDAMNREYIGLLTQLADAGTSRRIG
jgi:hypothetical protein